jgi:hypothetical protein
VSARRAGWWRRNRWALAALPLVLALVAVSGASRLVNFWWPSQLAEAVPAVVGQPVDHLVRTVDAEGEPTTFGATVLVGPTTRARDVTDADGMLHLVPHVDGTRVWRTDLTITAPGEHDAALCFVEVVDDRGRTTGYNPSTVGADGLPFTPCSPLVPTDELLDGTFVREETYTVPVLVRLAADVTPAELRLSWERPDYLSVPLEVTAEG